MLKKALYMKGMQPTPLCHANELFVQSYSNDASMQICTALRLSYLSHPMLQMTHALPKTFWSTAERTAPHLPQSQTHCQVRAHPSLAHLSRMHFKPGKKVLCFSHEAHDRPVTLLSPTVNSPVPPQCPWHAVKHVCTSCIRQRKPCRWPADTAATSGCSPAKQRRSNSLWRKVQQLGLSSVGAGAPRGPSAFKASPTKSSPGGTAAGRPPLGSPLSEGPRRKPQPSAAHFASITAGGMLVWKIDIAC